MDNETVWNYLNEKILHANDLYQNPTIQGLENLLINKLNNNAEKKLFRELKKGDPSLPAIIFIHPAGGGISLYKKLTDNVEFNKISDAALYAKHKYNIGIVETRRRFKSNDYNDWILF